MKRINVHITAPQYAALVALSTQTDRPFAEILRRAIDVYLDLRARQPQPPSRSDDAPPDNTPIHGGSYGTQAD